MAADPRRIGPYRVIMPLGSGAMGKVYLAEAKGGARVAVKVLAPTLAVSDGGRKRFAQEAEILGRLGHPNIVALRSGIACDGDLLYYVMEAVVGRGLDRVLKAQGPLVPAKALGVIAEALAGLGRAHEAGVVHRDVKPSNILVDRDGRAKVTDFGVALAIDRTRLTATGTLLGTPAYMAPELADGRDAGPAADIYSAGAVLFECLAGRPPFEAESMWAVLRKHLEAPPPAPSSFVPGLPASVDAAVQKALAKDPAVRFQSAAEMRDGLARALADVADARTSDRVDEEIRTLVQRETVEIAARPPAPRRRRLVGALVLLAAILSLGPFLLPGDLRPAGVADPTSAPVTVYRTGGEAVEGGLVAITGDAVVIEVPGGSRVQIPCDEVEAIEHRREAPAGP